MLLGLGADEFTPIFSGGTSLLKGHGLIKRFSEDIDFKLTLSEAFLAKSQGQRKKTLSRFKYALADAWKAAGFTNLKVEAGSGNGFIKVEMDYPSVLGGHDALRPHILAELSAKPPRLAPHECDLTSFVAKFRGDAAEVPSVPCVDPVETAADKLSAFAWRVIARDRGGKKDDSTIIRHVHDLAVLETIVAEDGQFGTLLEEILTADTRRGGGAVAELPPKERLAEMLARLTADEQYESDYRRFVEAMAFAEPNEIPAYDGAVQALQRLTERLPE